MSALKHAALRAIGAGRLPAPSSERMLLIEKAAARLQNRDTRAPSKNEPWDDFLRRIGLLKD